MLRIRTYIILLTSALSAFYSVLTYGQAIGSEDEARLEGTGTKLSFAQFAPYYNVASGYSTMIELNNSSQIPFYVSPTLFSPQGRPLSLVPILLEAHSHLSFDMSQWTANAGEEFRIGSVRLTHDGAAPYALGAQIMISNSKKGFALDVPFAVDPMFSSSKLHAIWWASRKDAQLQVAIQNATDKRVRATLSMSESGHKPPVSQKLSLAPHELQVLNLKQMLASKQLKDTSGGISIEHDGAPGAVVAEGWVFDPSTRFSASLPFTDTAADRVAKLSGAGVILGKAPQLPGATFEGHLLLRNTSTSSALVATPVLQRRQAKVDLGAVQLEAGETKEIPIAVDTLPDMLDAAGIEIMHTGAPGDLIGHWFSVDLSSGMVVETPLRVATPRGGNNPWTVEGDFSSVLYVKNTGDSPAMFLSSIWYTGGQYTIGLTEVPAGETAQIDLRKLRDDRVSDVSGQTLPTTLTSGQIHWQRRDGPPLLGRVLTASQNQGIGSNMSCPVPCCCSPRSASLSLAPSSSTWPVGAGFQETPWETDTNCDGSTQSYPLSTGDVTWGSTAPSVAWVSTGGWVTCTQPGTTTISGSTLISTQRRVSCGIGCCDCADISSHKMGTGTANVKPTISGPNTVWWFGPQVTQPNYSTQVMLTSSGGAATTWSVTVGGEKVSLFPSSGAQTNVMSSGTAFSSVPGDIKITASANNQTSDPFSFTTRTPHQFVPRGITRTCDSTFGYLDFFDYTILDQLNDLMPAAVDYNENWTTGVTDDFAGTNWRRGSPNGVRTLSSDPSGVRDMIGGENVNLPPHPPAVCVGPGQLVQHWGQEWRVGDTLSGQGRRVQTDILQKVTDHAEHNSIVSPVP